ncbi:unnamed protein product [Effrenium voratum]|nr:unnamed protein product [Effrenium voratum]
MGAEGPNAFNCCNCQTKLTADALAQLQLEEPQDDDAKASPKASPKTSKRRSVKDEKDKEKDKEKESKVKSPDEIFGPSDGEEGDEAHQEGEEGEEEAPEQDEVQEAPPGAPTGFTLKWDWQAETSQSPQGQEIKYEDTMLYHVGTTKNEVAIIVLPDLWGWKIPRVRLLADFVAQAVNGFAVVPRMLDNPPYGPDGHDDGVPEDYRMENLESSMHALRGWLMKNTYEFFLMKFRIAANFVRRHAEAKRIGIVGIGWGAWMACYGAEYLQGEFACSVMHTPLMHILGAWDGVSVARLIGKCDGPILFTLSTDEPKEYEPGGEFFAVNETKFVRQTESDDFRSMPNGFFSTADFEDLQQQEAIVRAFNRTAAFLRKFLWPFPLGGGYSYLRYQSSKGDVEHMKALLDLGVPAGGRDSKDEVEQPPIIYAARQGYGAACKLLVEYQADVDEIGGISRETALHVAVQHNKFKVVQILLNLRANPQLQDAGGQAALHRAAREGAMHSLQTLLSAAAFVDPRDTCEQTPVHIGCFFGREEMVGKLLAARADVMAEDIRGQTPRKVSDKHNYSTLVQLIDREIEKREIEEHYANEEREKQEQLQATSGEK